MVRRRQSAVGVVMASTVITAALVVAGGGPASADTACGNTQDGHCFALAQQGSYNADPPVYMSAVGADLEIDCLAVGDDTSEAATWAMWMSTNDTDPNSRVDSGDYVVEGYMAGPIGGGGGFYWFWADNRPFGGYNSHFIEWANALQYQNVSFYWQGGSNWNVYLAGNFVGESTNNAAFAGGVQIGASMAVDTNGQVHAHAHNWQFTNGGSWQWANPTDHYYSTVANPNPPGYVITKSFAPTNVTVHTPAHLCGTVPQIVQRTSAAAVTPLTMAGVRSIAARAAGSYATATPTAMTAVRTTRGAATALYGSKVNGAAAAEPVYLVQELGSFSVQQRSPSGVQHVTSARAMHVVISATTGQVLDWGIQAPGNLKSLGLVTPLI